MSQVPDNPRREPHPPRYFTVAEAATILSMSPEALQTRCRREARRSGRDVVALLGDGITAVKIGKLWRIRFSDPGTP